MLHHGHYIVIIDDDAVQKKALSSTLHDLEGVGKVHAGKLVGNLYSSLISDSLNLLTFEAPRKIIHMFGDPIKRSLW